MLYRMERNPDWNVFLNIFEADCSAPLPLLFQFVRDASCEYLVVLGPSGLQQEPKWYFNKLHLCCSCTVCSAIAIPDP
jgi:hypothetical protein